MTIYASVRARPLRVTGFQHGGWSPAQDGDTSARELPFEFSITDDGAGQFLLTCRSEDGSLYCDTWHETLEDAYASAEEEFGVSKKEWSVA